VIETNSSFDHPARNIVPIADDRTIARIIQKRRWVVEQKRAKSRFHFVGFAIRVPTDMYQVTRLENGLTVATAEMPQMASVSVGFWVAMGGRYETAAQSGISHFIEHMLFKGTRRRSAREISASVEGVGGYLNAFTAEENTCFYAKARYDRLEELVEVLADMFLNSVFDPEEISKERDVIKEEMDSYIDQPHQYVQELLNATMWPGQPLGRSITGTKKSLDRIGRPQLLDHLRGAYVAPNTLIAVAGRVEHKEVLNAVGRFARRLSPGPRSQFVPAVSVQTAPAISLRAKRTEQTQIALGIRGYSRRDERRHALRALNAVLGENMSSRLFQTIREDRGLAYSVYSGASFFDDVGDLVISAGLDADHLEKTLKLIVDELKRLTQQIVPAGELRRARDYVIGQMDLSLENSENQMMWAGESLLGYGEILDPDLIRQRVSQVRASDVRAVARDLFRPDRYNLAIVSPIKKTDGLEKLLA
jgi:predicted Zn-dependent peptidase